MDSLLKDVGYAARSLRKNLGFTLTAVLTLALGIGASTAIFSVVNAVLLRPLPYGEANRLVFIWGDMRARNVKDFPFPPGDYPDLKQGATLFEDIGAVVTGRVPLTGDNAEPEQIKNAGVTVNFFKLLGTRVALGRDFVADDGTPNQGPQPGAQIAGVPAPARAAPPTVGHPEPRLLAAPLRRRPRYRRHDHPARRQQRRGGRRARAGFELLFPPGVNIERNPDIYTAMRINFVGASRINVFMRLIGKLKPGVTREQAQTQLETIAADLRERFPIKKASDLHFRAESIHDDVVNEVKPAIVALMGAVIFVLLVACANVANLLLVRAAGREKELVLRTALGASRGRLMRQMLVESLLLAGIGAGLGLLLAQAGIELLKSIAPAQLPLMHTVRIDPMVLGFTVVMSIVAAVIFGVAPAVRASRPQVMDVLRASGRIAHGRGSALLRDSVVMAEVALSFILLVGSGLMVRSFIALQNADPGYDPNGVLTFQVFAQRPQDEARAAFMRELRERLGGLPGVTSVAAGSPLPLDGLIQNARWGTEAAVTDPSKFQQADVHVVLPGYFETMKTRLVEGRVFTEADNRDSSTAMVVDQRFAAKAFPGERAVGKRIYIRFRSNEPEWMDVIGVVAHQRGTSLSEDSREAVFFADGQFGHGAAGRWLVRTSGDPARLGAAVRAEVARIDPNLPVGELLPYSVFVDRAMASTRFALVMIALFAVVAAILAAVGLYGVLSTVVRQRTAEIGVRMVFGAPRSSILFLIVGQGIRLSVAGVVLGIVGALAMTRVIASLLVGVKATDPVTFVVMALLFCGIGAVASFLPAQRAAALDPSVALRDE